MAELEVGGSLGGRFRLERLLADRGPVQVWLASSVDDGQWLALKCVDRSDPAGPVWEARQQHAFEVSSLMGAEVSVACFQPFDDDGWSVMPMTYMTGGDLSQFRGRPWEDWLASFEALLRQLQRVHAAGFVHGDLKPGNVLMDASGAIRLADFEHSLPFGAQPGGGTPGRQSPQRLRGEPAAASDDLYALGALLYELLTAYPPFYPDPTPERVFHAPVPVPVPRHHAPDRLSRLALRLLAKSTEDRPDNVESVLGELKRMAAEGEMRPAPLRPTGRPLTDRVAQHVTPVWWAAGAGSLIGLLFFAAFYWLPDWAERRAVQTATEAAAEAASQIEASRRDAQQVAETLEARTAAEAARQDHAEIKSRLDSQPSALWAAPLLAQARASAEAAVTAMELGQFKQASQSWLDASQALQSVESGRGQALIAALEQGGAALEKGDQATAQRSFDLALAIEPGHQAAIRGRARAATLDAVFSNLDQAARLEAAGQFTAARAAYEAALTLDDEAPGAEAGIQRIRAREAGDRYAMAMASGLEAVAAGRLESARSQLELAASLRPDADAPSTALQQLPGLERDQQLQAAVVRAQSAESGENWAEATRAWREANTLQPTLQVGVEGLRRSESRLALESRIEALLQSPERLWTPAGRSEASRVIAQARKVTEPRQKLDAMTSEVELRLAEAEQPVRVLLSSDGLTEVVVYRVGRFGSFQSREVEIVPGRYSVVGTRPGYRDVRLELEVRPGAGSSQLTVRCEEAI